MRDIDPHSQAQSTFNGMLVGETASQVLIGFAILAIIGLCGAAWWQLVGRKRQEGVK